MPQLNLQIHTWRYYQDVGKSTDQPALIIAEAKIKDSKGIPVIHCQLQFRNESRHCAVSIKKVVREVPGYPSPAMPVEFALEDDAFARLRNDFFESERSGATSIAIFIESDDLGELSEDNPIYTHQEPVECDRWRYSITFKRNADQSDNSSIEGNYE